MNLLFIDFYSSLQRRIHYTRFALYFELSDERKKMSEKDDCV